MNQIQASPIFPFLNANNNDEQKKNQMETELATDNMFKEFEGDISRIPSLSNENINDKEDLLKDIEAIKGKQKEKKDESKNDNKFVKKKRKRANPNFCIIKNEKSSTIQLMQYKNKKKNNYNNNSPFELEYCYKKLNKIISKYSFDKISEILLKINNNIDIEKDDNEIFKKIKKITSIIKKKQDIILMILRILTKNHIKCLEAKNNPCSEDNKEEEDIKKYKNNKENKEKEPKIKEEKEKEEEEDVEEKNEENKEGKKDKENSENYIIFKDHYHNDGYNIYCYKPKKVKKSNLRCTLYCSETYNKNCKAKIIVFTNSNYINFLGNHNHYGISKEDFYNVYPFLKKTTWQDIQVICENGKNILKLQS